MSWQSLKFQRRQELQVLGGSPPRLALRLQQLQQLQGGGQSTEGSSRNSAWHLASSRQAVAERQPAPVAVEVVDVAQAVEAARAVEAAVARDADVRLA